jgi:hypothetical protein
LVPSICASIVVERLVFHALHEADISAGWNALGSQWQGVILLVVAGYLAIRRIPDFSGSGLVQVRRCLGRAQLEQDGEGEGRE